MASYQVSEGLPEWKFNQQFPGRVMARSNPPVFAKNQLIIVATEAGIANLIILLNALVAIDFLASSGFPALDNLSGFIEHT